MEEPTFAHRLPIPRKPTQTSARLWYVHGQIGDGGARFLVDTGAVVSIIPKSLFDSLASAFTRTFRPFDQERHVTGFTGEVTPTLGELDIDVVFHSAALAATFLVVNEDVDCILGIDFLTRYQVAQDFSQQVLMV